MLLPGMLLVSSIPHGISLCKRKNLILRPLSHITESVFEEALTLKPSEKAQLVEKLLHSLDEPDKEIDKLWAKEVENRIDAYTQGKIKAVSLEEVLSKYKQKMKF